MTSFKNAVQALKELGLQKVSLYALYQIGMKTGCWKQITPSESSIAFIRKDMDYFERFPWQSPASSTLTHISGGDTAAVIADANLILEGKIKFFSGKTDWLDLAPKGTEKHWCEVNDNDPYQDVKFIWESARFSWAYTLCRAYQITQNDQYAEAFWNSVEDFIHNNPVNMGPNWASGQEIALRLIAWIISGIVFKDSPSSTETRKKLLISSLADHAVRLPKTLIYARAQNNNHLVTEAAGMFTAGVFFKNNQWKLNGWKWLETALQRQINSNGTYVQQSTNYHRLMLQTVLWVNTLLPFEGLKFSKQTRKRLANASKWMITYLDPNTGEAINLGHNDGSLIMPLSSCEYTDYRPTAQAAAIAFLEQPYLPSGPWDEYCMWLGLNSIKENPIIQNPERYYQPGILRIGSAQTWAILRAEKFTDRPAHADQLHVDLWWEGENIAMDAGTYRYTAPAPWMNGLAHTGVHNTIEINDQDQMLQISRFLWLNWANAQKKRTDMDQCLSASHSGYQRSGAVHQRTICHTPPLAWTITDEIQPGPKTLEGYKICLHWLLPNWDWNLTNDRLKLEKDQKQINLWVTAKDQSKLYQGPEYIQIVQAGKVISGPEEDLTTLGWFSPTYDVKIPALSLRCVYQTSLPFEIKTYWNLKNDLIQPK